MKKQHVFFIFAQLIVLLAMAGQPLVSEVSAEEDRKTEECACVSTDDRHKEFHEYIRIHKDFYMELLTEKYLPEQTDDWKNIRSERDLLYKKLNEAKKRGELMHGDVRSKEWVQVHHDLQKQLTKAVKDRDEEQIAEILPQILKHYEKLNGEFQDRINTMTESSS